MKVCIGLIYSLIVALSLTGQEKSLPIMQTNVTTDSLLVVVDGVPYNILIENKQLPPFELAISSLPLFSLEDIESAELITRDQLFEKGQFYHYPKAGLLLIKTNKESAIKEFILNGKTVRRRKGIELGCLLDQKVLLQQMKKKWHINPKRIRSLEVKGKSICIATK